MNKYFVALILYLSLNHYTAQAMTGIEVIGKSSVMVVPDSFIFTISIKERGIGATVVKTSVDNKSQKITEMLIKNGVAEHNIDSSQVRMFPIYDKPSINLTDVQFKAPLNNNENIKENERGVTNAAISSPRFEVSRTITLSLEQLTTYDKILEQVVKLGVSHISPLEMSIKASETHYQTALFQAIEKAKLKALKIAKQAGVKLGELTSLKESGYHSPLRYRMASDGRSEYASRISQKAISAQVIAIYQIKP